MANHTKQTPGKLALANRLYDDGLSLVQIAPQVGASDSVVGDWLKKSGRNLRDPRLPRGVGKTVRHDFFRKIDSDTKAWMLGFIASDGCVVGSCLKITLSVRDREVLDRIQSILSPDGHVSESERKSGFGVAFGRRPRCCSIQIWSRQLVSDLARHGIGERKSLTYEAWNGPKRWMPAYMRGLMDGDGSWNRMKDVPNGFRPALCGTKSVVECFAKCAKQWCGANVKVRPNRMIWTGQINSLTKAQIFSDVLYRDAEIWLQRKRECADLLCSLTIEPRQSWESITREHIIRLYRETRHWPTVADRLDVPLNSLLIYRSRKYGIDGRSLRAEYLT